MFMATREERENAVSIWEARIQLYKEQIGTGYIGIGRTLNEAKESGRIGHGEWEGWVTRVTGLTIRQAQRCMQAAREIREGTEMARLEMSKAIMLLSSGLEEEEREEIARKTHEEGLAVRELKEEIRKAKAAREAADAENAKTVQALKLKLVQETGAAAEIREALKKAEKEREGLKGQLEATVRAYQKRIDEAEGDAYRRGMQEQASGMEREIRKEFQGKIDHINSQRQQAEERIQDMKGELEEARRETCRVQDRVMEKEREIAELKEELEAAEEREEKRAEELSRIRKEKQAAAMESARGLSASGFGGLDLAAAVRSFIGAAGVLPQMGGTLSRMDRGERETIRENIDTVARWVDGAREALGMVSGEGSWVE